MRIREIRALGLRGATPKGGARIDPRPADCINTLIAVFTDEGLVGWGSAFTNDGLVRRALAILEPLYMGENALEPERVTEKLHQHTFWLGRGGTVTHAISGINIALWDLLGKATGQPIGRLLGGRYRERVRPYASLLMEEPQPLVDRLVELKEYGFRAFKIGWGPFGRRSDALDEQIVREARKAVGTEALLMVDAGGSDAFWPQVYKWALRTAHMLSSYGVNWFEEPLQPDALSDYVRLREHAPVPIAAGEVLTRRQSFVPWLQTGALDIVQPDVTKVGGLSEARRIAWLAEDNGTRFVPHGWNTAVGLAADLQLVSAVADANLVEYIVGSPYVDQIAASPWTPDDQGMLPIPTGPGLGVALDLEAVSRYTAEDVQTWA